MNAYQKAPSLEKPSDILANCKTLNPQDGAFMRHPIIERFGSPNCSIYVDDAIVEIEGIEYENPLILPIYDEHLEIIQCAVLQDEKLVKTIPYGQSQGFTYYGDLQKDKPVIIARALGEFFKLSQTGYAVVLVVLPHLCNKRLTELKPYDFTQIERVINQLSNAGYQYLYLPVRPENIKSEPYQTLENTTQVRLLNQYQIIDGDDCFIDLSQYDDAREVKKVLDEVIKKLPTKPTLQKDHLAKPMKWENGYFHILKDGIYFSENDSKGFSQKRFISSLIMVEAKTHDCTSNNWGVLLKWKDDNDIEHKQAVSMELFQTDGADLRKTLSYQGVKIASHYRSRGLFQSYLMNYPTEQRALCVDKVGWHEKVFVLPHKKFGISANNEIIVYQANHGLDNLYQSKGSLEQWQSVVSKLVENHSLLVFSLCTAFAGQLLDPLNQQGGGFHFKGGSSKGKSTGLNLACSVWGNPKNFYRTWKATGNAIEHTAYMHNDSFLVLDEIGEIANPKELGNIIYMLANGSGKGRMTKQITAKATYKWKVLFLSSGEKSLKEIMLEQGQKAKLGQEIRLADIDIDQSEYGIFDCIDFAEDGAKQAIELNKRINDCYGVAGNRWLEYLTHDKSRIMDDARDLLEAYREVLTESNTQGHITRVANYFALVATAGELATKANITGWKTGTALNAVKKVFNQWLNGFEQVGDYEHREMITHVKAFFEANESSRFEAITPDPDHNEKIINRVGYWKIDNGAKIFYVLNEQFKKEVCKGYDSRKVAKALQAYGLLEHDTGKTGKTVRLPSKANSIKVYAVKESIFSWGA